MKRKLIYLLIPFVIQACSGDPTVDPEPDVRSKPLLKILAPMNEDQFTIGDELEIQFEIPEPAKVSEVELFIADTLYQSGLKNESQTIRVATDKSKVGFVKIYVSYKDESGKQHGDTRSVVFFSDITPKKLTAVQIKSYPHEKTSYTQGLEFYQGKLFEGTGQIGQSILAEVDLNTGTILRKRDLEKRFFGEGITILNDTIYQITWSERTCFVYDMNFNLLNELSYEGEGWGLCNDGEHLIMSNGTSEVVWRNRHTFEIVKKMQVFDDEMEYGNLNELELIQGNLFINVYTEEQIIEVDTATGKVISRIDCGDIVRDGRVPGADVLNGIAHNPVTGKTYITGKWWPKLYEVKFEE